MILKYIKKNKKMFIVIGVFLLFVVLLIPIKTVLFPNSGKAIYGNRLDGIEKVPISSKTSKNLKDKFKEDAVRNVTYRVSGKTVELIITVAPEVSIDTAKKYGDKSLEVFSEAQRKFYDFQIFVTKEETSTEFPIIGYKHHSKSSITWTKNRTGSAKWEKKH